MRAVFCADWCREGDVLWYSFWGFLAMIVLWGVVDLWHRFRR